MLRRTRHKKEPHTVLERRTWEPWTEKENNIFFESLEKHSRNWAEIAKDIGTKKQEQVRAYIRILLVCLSPTDPWHLTPFFFLVSGWGSIL